MQTTLTRFSDNGEIINDSQKICIIFQKVQNPILTEIKAALQVSYDLYQDNTVTYELIAKILATESSSLGDHNPTEVGDINTRG